jgi:hypothetical protein
MSLFLKHLHDITYDDIKAFCDAYPEGVRVEYKKEVANTAKTVSSFANSSGGVWVVGVSADDEKDKREIIGAPRRAGYEEQIVQSCLTGVYPPLRPDVRVCDIPGTADKVLIVVKITESIEAPHAIENSTRAYIRTGNVSQPYELTDMDRLEYMFKRREQAETKREDLINRMASRSRVPKRMVHLQIVISPTYPRVPVKTLDEVEQFVFDYQAKNSRGYFDRMRRVAGGMMNLGGLRHLELNEFGVVLEENLIPVNEVKDRAERSIYYIQRKEVMAHLYYIILIARNFVGDNLLNVMLRVRLSHCDGIWLARGDVRDELWQPDKETHTSFESVAHAETRVAMEGLRHGDPLVRTMADVLKQLSWHFNRSDLAEEADVRDFLSGTKSDFLTAL